MVQRNVLDGETAPPGPPLSSALVPLKRIPASHLTKLLGGSKREMDVDVL